MPAYEWFATPVNSAGTSTAASTLVTVWVGSSNPGGYTIYIFDANGDGLVSSQEWQSYTGGGLGLNGGSATVLFDGAPGGAGIIYSATSYPAGATNLKAGLRNNFTVDPANLDVPPHPAFVPEPGLQCLVARGLSSNCRPGILSPCMMAVLSRSYGWAGGG